MTPVVTTDYNIVSGYSAAERWAVKDIIWDLTARPMYNGKPTRKYYDKCLSAQLPLPSTIVYVGNAGFNRIVNILADYYQCRIKSCRVYLVDFPS